MTKERKKRLSVGVLFLVFVLSSLLLPAVALAGIDWCETGTPPGLSLGQGQSQQGIDNAGTDLHNVEPGVGNTNVNGRSLDDKKELPIDGPPGLSG